MDDQRLGLVLRALRRRANLRQVDVARRSGLDQSTISRVERGHLDRLSLGVIRRLTKALDARVDLQLRWRGGEIDRVIDERHSRLAATAAGELARLGWSVLAELSYSVFGERGSIDLVAYHERLRLVVMLEVKTSITSVEELLRQTDAKLRLLPALIQERLGWRPRSVVRILVVEDQRTNRRRITEHRALLAHAFPGSTIATRRWLRSPGDSPPPGIWFLPPMPGRTAQQGAHRVGRSRRPS